MKYGISFFLFFYFLTTLNSQNQVTDSSNIYNSLKPLIKTPKLIAALKRLQQVNDNRKNKNYNGADTVFTIIHIGDSHVQGDYFSGEIRKQLQGYFGNGGQGILFPYAIAKSFGPRGTTLKSSGKWQGLKILSPDLIEPLGLIGYAAITYDKEASINLTFDDKFETPLFKKINIWHSARNESYQTQLNKEFILLEEKSYPSGWGISSFYSPELTNSFSLTTFNSNVNQKYYAFYGFELVPLISKGIIYHHCGVVGAQFTHLINHAPYTIEQIVSLKPDLIIFSFGTNEAYDGGLDTLAYKLSVLEFIDKLQLASSNSAIVLTTAPDTRSNGRIPSMQISINNQLKVISKKCNLSLFDLNDAMGGWGSIYAWNKNQLTLPDKLHFTAPGYSLQGKLFTLSLLQTYNKINNDDTINIDILKSSVLEQMLLLTSVVNNDTSKSDFGHNPKNKNFIQNKKNGKNKIHKVIKGQTISQIAKMYNVSAKSILLLNHIKEKTTIKIGQRIIISKK